MKIFVVIILGILNALSLTLYFIEPILGWTGFDKFVFIPPRFSPYPELLSIGLASLLFYLPLSFVEVNNKRDFFYRISLTSIWTALPGSIVALHVLAMIIETFGFSFRFFQAFASTALIFTAFFLPLYVVLISPTQTRIYRDVILVNSSLSKPRALLFALSLTVLPFIGVTVMKVMFHVSSTF